MKSYNYIIDGQLKCYTHPKEGLQELGDLPIDVMRFPKVVGNNVVLDSDKKAQYELLEEENLKRSHNAKIKASLAEIDIKSIRAIRDNDTEWILKYKNQADALRAQLKK